ncbi:hypothetical protein AB0F81_01965 [Actinoplanes sp. NPDC024001]|uniref:hypothetical protein n=1 Tax=Actinoplanes sp. NPDC024001 TaxID=3154598 RepID=UPI0033E38631
MERGPLTLFGAIVAIGVGPALWLGAQLGAVNVAPGERPSTVGEQFPDTGAEVDFGGVGAGAAPETTEPAARHTVPAIISRTTKPTRSAPADPPVRVSRSASASPSVPASSAPPSVSPSASPSVELSTSEPATPPTESSSAPPEDPGPSEPPQS